MSERGREQARALGEYWARHDVRFDSVYVGPRRRHHHTLEIVREAFAEHGLSWPDSREIPELDEHQGIAVMRHYLGLGGLGEETMHGADPGAEGRERAMRAFFGRYFEVLRDWARGAIDVPGIEPWAAFRARSARALDILCGSGESVVAFTSGGLVSSAAGWLLGIDANRVIDLSAVLRNTALTEVECARERRRLISFNALPHLPGVGKSTAV